MKQMAKSMWPFLLGVLMAPLIYLLVAWLAFLSIRVLICSWRGHRFSLGECSRCMIHWSCHRDGHHFDPWGFCDFCTQTGPANTCSGGVCRGRSSRSFFHDPHKRRDPGDPPSHDRHGHP